MIPEIIKLLKIIMTIPVSTCTAERSFSALRRIKTYLRSTMTQQRLNDSDRHDSASLGSVWYPSCNQEATDYTLVAQFSSKTGYSHSTNKLTKPKKEKKNGKQKEERRKAAQFCLGVHHWQHVFRACIVKFGMYLATLVPHCQEICKKLCFEMASICFSLQFVFIHYFMEKDSGSQRQYLLTAED
nr:unnamed protein product [Callosobruchus chinensis]